MLGESSRKYVRISRVNRQREVVETIFSGAFV